MYFAHSFGVERVEYCKSDLIHLIIAFIRLQLLDYYDILLINCRYKVLCLGCKKCSQCLKCIVILLMLSLNYEHKSPHICLNVKLLSPVIYINKKKIIKKKILYKIILIESLLVCDKKILYLKCCNLADHIYIIAAALCQQHIF